MALAHRASISSPSHALSVAATATPVGASYAFDPGADGLAAIYARRILERGIDPRALCAEVRADRLGAPERGAVNRSLIQRVRASRFGRGTAAHLEATTVPLAAPLPPAPTTATRATKYSRPTQVRWSRRLVAACLAALLLIPVGVIVASAQELPVQSRYVVQEGDMLAAVAAEFGVDPAAILASSAIQNPPYLTPAEVIIIPDPSETPEEAAWNAAQLQGTSPFVIGAHDVQPGETVADIAIVFGVDPVTLASFNGIADVEALAVGQRLRIPAASGRDARVEDWVEYAQPAERESGQGPLAAAPDAPLPDTAPIFAADVPAYMQAYSLSCEYAAAFIATAAFGPGVPESAFVERIGLSATPHWGYRGNITGPWGGTDDYGIYPEALVPTLNEFGFVADVFYGDDPTSLTARLDAGMPVVTWLGYFGNNAWVQEDEGAYLLAPGMHVVTVYGYDDWGVYLSNPGRGSYDYYAWDDFLAKWAVLGGMAMAVAPM